jgi:predicted AAA+ superfamily ATPase
LQALAFQVGSQVSYNELGQICGLDSKTVEKYVLLLEHCFIIFRLNSFGRNLRNELTSSKKIYFYDNGIRNALTTNFNPLELRNDVGALWENFLMAERMKFNAYNQQWFHTYFWKTRTQQEIDYLEEGDGKLYAYEFKWSPKKASKLPKSFEQAYPGAEFKVIHRDNAYEFLLGKKDNTANK